MGTQYRMLSNLPFVSRRQISKKPRNPEKPYLASGGSRIVGERRESSLVLNGMHSLVRLWVTYSSPLSPQ
jgi:hypothetical protein